jgi:hypothetical protein
VVGEATWREPMSAEPAGESTGEVRPLRISPELARELLRVLRERQTRIATLDRRHFAAIKPRHVAASELLP